MFDEHSAMLAVDAGDDTGRRKLGGGRNDERCGANASSKWAAKVGLGIATLSGNQQSSQELLISSRPVRSASPLPGGFGPSSSNFFVNLSI